MRGLNIGITVTVIGIIMIFLFLSCVLHYITERKRQLAVIFALLCIISGVIMDIIVISTNF